MNAMALPDVDAVVGAKSRSKEKTALAESGVAGHRGCAPPMHDTSAAVGIARRRQCHTSADDSKSPENNAEDDAINPVKRIKSSE